MSYEDDSFSLGGRSHGSQVREHPEGWTDGHVVTPHAIVAVYAEAGYSRLGIAYGGRQHMRVYRKRLTPRGLVTAATRFARELVGAAGEQTQGGKA